MQVSKDYEWWRDLVFVGILVNMVAAILIAIGWYSLKRLTPFIKTKLGAFGKWFAARMEDVNKDSHRQAFLSSSDSHFFIARIGKYFVALSTLFIIFVGSFCCYISCLIDPLFYKAALPKFLPIEYWIPIFGSISGFAFFCTLLSIFLMWFMLNEVKQKRMEIINQLVSQFEDTEYSQILEKQKIELERPLKPLQTIAAIILLLAMLLTLIFAIYVAILNIGDWMGY